MDNLERYFTHLCKEKAEKNNGVLKIHKVQKLCFDFCLHSVKLAGPRLC